MMNIILHRVSVAVLLLCGLLLGSCVGEKSASSGSYQSNARVKKAGDAKDKDPEERMMIYNATLDMVVKVPDTLNNRLSEIAKKYNGYVQSIGTTQTVIRVEAKSLENAIAEIERHGKRREKYLYGQDITDEYKDHEIRLENAERARKRYLELLAQAQNVSETLLVEKELDRLNQEIERLKGHMQRMEHLHEFSTITVNIQEKKKPGVVGYVFVWTFKAVRWLFIRNP